MLKVEHMKKIDEVKNLENLEVAIEKVLYYIIKLIS